MFSVVNSFSELPSVVNNGDRFFCSLENNVFVYFNDSWVDYETFVDGFEEIASVNLNNDINISNEMILFDNAPFYEEFKQDYIYPILCSCQSLTSFENNIFNFNIIKEDNTPIFSCSSNNIFYPEFKHYFYISQEAGSQKDLEKTKNRLYTHAFNISCSNISIKAPFSFKLLKPIGV